MRKTGLLLSMVILSPFAVALSAQRLQPANGARPAAAAAQTTEQNDRLLQALYISEFQRQVGVTDEVAGQFRPILMQWLQQRRNVVARRNAAVAELRRLVESGASESEIARQTSEVDQAENQTRNAERRLMNQVDQLLTPAQQARFRIFQVDMEQRIRELLEAARQPAPANNRQQQANRQRGNAVQAPVQANRQKAPVPARENTRKALTEKQR